MEGHPLARSRRRESQMYREDDGGVGAMKKGLKSSINNNMRVSIMGWDREVARLAQKFKIHHLTA